MSIDTPALARDRRFFAIMAAAALATVFAGFAPSYYLRPVLHIAAEPSGRPIAATLPAIVHVHAALFSLWIVLFGTQAGLVATGRVGLHRRLGAISALIIPAMLVTGVLTAIQGARDGWNPGGPFGDPLGFMLVGLVDIGIFTTLATAGLYFRRRPDLHRRLMLFATLGGLMWPAITRTFFIAPRLPAMLGLLGVLVLAPVVRDFRLRSSMRWLSLTLAIGIIASLPLRGVVARTAAWHQVAAWMTN
jgi:hypothetical protein